MNDASKGVLSSDSRAGSPQERAFIQALDVLEQAEAFVKSKISNGGLSSSYGSFWKR